MQNHCYCGSAKLYQDCCRPFLHGLAVAATPEQLMRSRYSAYAQGNFGEYLLATWFPPMATDLTVASLSEKTHDWCDLAILDSGNSGDSGWVEFKADFRTPDGIDSLHERSVFTRINTKWFYVGGEIK
jgi:SEC-C motif-containing protein